jgi:hypothetical protein
MSRRRTSPLWLASCPTPNCQEGDTEPRERERGLPEDLIDHLRKAPEGWTRTLRHDEGRVSLMCDCRSDWVMCFRRDCERAAALNEATSSRSNEHLNLLMTPVGASKGQQAMAVAMRSSLPGWN